MLTSGLSQSSGFLSSGSSMYSLKGKNHIRWKITQKNIRLIPILRLLSIRVLNFLFRQQLPISLKLSTFCLLSINLDFIGVVWIENKRVQMSKNIILGNKLISSIKNKKK